VAFLELGQAVDGRSRKCLARQFGSRTPQFGGQVTTRVRQSGIRSRQTWNQGLASRVRQFQARQFEEQVRQDGRDGC